jgi:hypothetical protein
MIKLVSWKFSLASFASDGLACVEGMPMNNCSAHTPARVRLPQLTTATCAVTRFRDRLRAWHFDLLHRSRCHRAGDDSQSSPGVFDPAIIPHYGIRFEPIESEDE